MHTKMQPSRITNIDVFLQTSKEGYGGFQMNPPKQQEKLQHKEMDDTRALIDENELLIMEEYAERLPRGKRQLKLNMPELRDMLISNVLESSAGTKTSGINAGGKLSYKEYNDKGKNTAKLLSMKEHMYTIKNKNKLVTNPNPTSFKNVGVRF